MFPPPPLLVTIDILTSQCDPTVDIYGAFHVVRGDEVIDVRLTMTHFC
jgi:D-serine deaminase-like pyridoxal phosphate-dependent protein